MNDLAEGSLGRLVGLGALACAGALAYGWIMNVIRGRRPSQAVARARSFALLSAAACTFVAADFACSRQDPAPGALVLAVNTDMSVPKDVDAVGLYISTGGNVIFQRAETVAPTGRVRFPATLSIVGQKTAGAPVEIRAVAFTKRTAKVVREAITTVPVSRQALLRMPLEWISARASGEAPESHIWTVEEGQTSTLASEHLTISTDLPSGSGGLEPLAEFNPWADIDSGCLPQTTDIGGDCVDAHIDSSTLPDYNETELYGDGGSSGQGGPCFDTLGCFRGLPGNIGDAIGEQGGTAGAGGGVDVPTPPDNPGPPGDPANPYNDRIPFDRPNECVATIPEFIPIDKMNVAMLNPPGTEGACRDDGCLIPLNRGGSGGYVVEDSPHPRGALYDAPRPNGGVDRLPSSGKQGRLPRAYCKRVEDGRSLALVVSIDCAPKTDALRVCGPGEGTAGFPTGDAGGDGGVDFPRFGNPTEEYALPFADPTRVFVENNRVMVIGAGGDMMAMDATPFTANAVQTGAIQDGGALTGAFAAAVGSGFFYAGSGQENSWRFGKGFDGTPPPPTDYGGYFGIRAIGLSPTGAANLFAYALTFSVSGGAYMKFCEPGHIDQFKGCEHLGLNTVGPGSLPGNMQKCHDVAVDSTGTAVIACDDSGIWALSALPPSASSTFTSLYGGTPGVERGPIKVDAAMAVWTEGGRTGNVHVARKVPPAVYELAASEGIDITGPPPFGTAPPQEEPFRLRRDIALHRGYVCWATGEIGGARVVCALADNSQNAVDVAATGLVNPMGVASDDNHVYWVDMATGKLGRVPFNVKPWGGNVAPPP